jgi:hypothetical protein
VDIPLAKNMAERVEGLISSVALNWLEKELLNESMSLRTNMEFWIGGLLLSFSEEVAKEKFCKFKDKKEAMEIVSEPALLITHWNCGCAP